MTIIRTWSQQRKSSVTIRWIEQRKMSFLKLVLKNIKKWMRQKKKQCLKNRREKYKQMDVSQKKQLLSKIAEHSRKRYHSMDCKKKEKHQHKKKSISNSSTDQKNFKT